MSGLEFDALCLVAVAGTALLALTCWTADRAADSTTGRVTRGSWITLVVRAVSLAVLAWAFAARHDSTTSLAVGALVLTAAEVVAAIAVRSGLRSLAPVVTGGFCVAAASAFEGDAAAGLAVAGVGVVVLVTIATRRMGVVALPGLFVVAAHHLAAAEVSDGAIDRVGLSAAIVGVLAAVVVLRSGHTVPDTVWRDTVWFAVALVVLAQDAPDLRAAGLLLAGGAVLATASRHPIATVALVPGAAAAVEALGVADHPVHAVAGASVLLVIVAAGVGTGRSIETDASAGSGDLGVEMFHHWPAALAAAFAVVPLWGWSGADVGVGYNTSVAAALATAGVVGVLAFGRLRRSVGYAGAGPRRRHR